MIDSLVIQATVLYLRTHVLSEIKDYGTYFENPKKRYNFASFIVFEISSAE